MNIRPYQPADEAAVVEVWYGAGKAAYTFLSLWQELTKEKALAIFREHILPEHEIWVAEEGHKIVAYMALKGNYISRLYVNPEDQSHGVGDALLEHARNLHPDGLELHTHVENYPARQFYERRGFVAVKFGISPAPEFKPDVEYHWRPSHYE